MRLALADALLIHLLVKGSVRFDLAMTLIADHRQVLTSNVVLVPWITGMAISIRCTNMMDGELFRADVSSTVLTHSVGETIKYLAHFVPATWISVVNDSVCHDGCLLNW
jgi:hypothetical protein